MGTPHADEKTFSKPEAMAIRNVEVEIVSNKKQSHNILECIFRTHAGLISNVQVPHEVFISVSHKQQVPGQDKTHVRSIWEEFPVEISV